MLKKTFEYLFFLSTFFSLIATTYSPPWTSSSMEFFAFLSTIFLFFSLPFSGRRIFLPESSIFILIFLFFSAAFYFINKIQLSEQLWLAFLYGIFFIISASCVAQKSEKFQEKFCITILATSLFNCFVILSQYFSLYDSELGIWIAGYDHSHGRPYGNFGQPNLVATLLLTGLCSGVWLYKKTIDLISLLFLSIFIGVALAFPSSKTSFLCIAILMLLAIMLRDKHALIVFTTTAVATFLTKNLLPNTREITAQDISTGRFDLWLTILDALFKSPWTGYGVLNTRIAHFESREINITPLNQVIGSAHNLFLDFMVWFGVVIGIFLIAYFLYIIFTYFKKNITSPENLYLIIPILLHSQLEYPLYYANFLLLFAFILNRGNESYIDINSSKASYILFIAGIFVLSVITFDYLRISKNYTDLRFFNNNFLNAKKPETLNLIALDTTGGQYNFFLKDKITTEEEFRELETLTKAMPSFKSYSLIITYLTEIKKDKNKTDYWLKKAEASFSKNEYYFLEKLANKHPAN